MRKFVPGIFLALLCSASTVEFKHLVVNRKIKDANRHLIPFNSIHTNVKKTDGSSSDAFIHLTISESKNSFLLVCSASFHPTRMTAGSDFTSRLTPCSSSRVHQAEHQYVKEGNVYENQKHINHLIRHSGTVVTV